jgi:hypothetical protein
MPTVAGWSLLGIVSVVAIVAGILLLAVYALRRGVLHRDLAGTIEPEMNPRTLEAPPPATSSAGSSPTAISSAARPGDARTLGAAGATLLVVGLALGLVGAITGWGGSGSSEAGGPGQAPVDCAQSWEGCPQATPAVP